MNVIRHPSAASFLEHAEAGLMRAEVDNNVILGIAHGAAAGTWTSAEPA